MIVNLSDITIKLYLVKTLFIICCTYATFFKIINDKKYFDKKKIIGYIGIFMLAILITIVKTKTNSVISTIFLVIMLSYMCSMTTEKNIGYSINITIIALSINYAILTIATIIVFLLNYIVKINKDSVNFIIMTMNHVFILNRIFQMNRFKYGISFLQKNSKNEYIDIPMLNIGISVLILTILFSNKDLMVSRGLIFYFITLLITMGITIQKSLQLYYKQKLLVQELNETKEELESTKKELKQVEEENLSFSKKSHSIAHKQKSLEYKIQQLTSKAEISIEEAGEVKDRLKEIKKDLYKDKATVELSKTEIPEIDDMLKYMQSECIKNKIDFELQLTGNIHHMTNNLISKEDLEILLADHIKDAIIAVNHTDNINKSILVRLGEIEGVYSLYIYDSGIEFEIETLENLGKKPSTTHADEGGTGMGFMNTFDTLRKYEASLIINELNKTNKDNYTKVIIFKFDKKNEFKIISYRQEELNKRNI